MRKTMTILALVLGIGVAIVWAAGPTALQVKFKLPPKTNAVKPVVVVDGDGDLLFNATTPGQVAVTNFPPASGPLGPTAASQIVTVRASGACSGVSDAEAFDYVVDASGSSSLFNIPPGEVFVVTSVSVIGGTGTPAATPGNPVQVQLIVGNWGLAIRNVDASPSGSVSLEATFPTGVVVRSGTELCISGKDLANLQSVGLSGTVNGYLAADS